MANLLLSSRDVEFLLFEWLKADSLTSRPRYSEHSREVFDAVLALSEQIAVEEFAPHNRMSDVQEPTFDGERVHVIPEVERALTAFANAGLIGAGMDASVGGEQLPHVISRACFTWFAAANSATSAYPMLSMGNANLLTRYGTPEQIDRFVRPVVEGRFFGTMCLSEPDVGSSLADVTTRAVPSDDGSYRVFGSKMWISAGDHEMGENIVHLVLARAAGSPAGAKGLSLFIVPRFLVNDDGSIGERNDVVLGGLNHKMGYRGTVNALLNFGEGKHTPGGEAGAVGYLVGEQNRGLDYMFHMMNEARVAVGASAVALGYSGYLHALEYARTRPQGRLAWAKDPGSPQVPIVQHADVRRMLLASKSYVEGGLALILFTAKLLDEEATAQTPEEADRVSLLLDMLTPIAKGWPSQWCLRANDHAIQVHGGYGYTREYPVEQMYRDNRLNPIHEGTDGIQGLDLLGRKVVVRNGEGLRVLVEAITAATAKAPESLSEYANTLNEAIMRVVRVTALLWKDRDPRTALANSQAYADAVGHIVVAWLWLEQMTAAEGKTGTFYDGKRLAGRYFFTHELPRTGPMLDLLESGDTLLVDLDDECL